jgi:heme-degrading monooxygenase HmoA
VVLETALLKVRAGNSENFESAFRVAERIIIAAPGYISHQLRRCPAASSFL